MLIFMAGSAGGGHQLFAATARCCALCARRRWRRAVLTSCRILVNVMFAPADRPRASRIFMLGIFMASALAPAMAAELTEHGVWQDVFCGVLPFAALAALGAWLLLPDAEPGQDDPGPALGPLLLFGAAVVSLQAAMTEARFDIFSHPLRLALICTLGIGLLMGFLWQQWHHSTPVLHLRALRNPVYLTGLAMYFVYYLISNLSGYVFPIYAERALEPAAGDNRLAQHLRGHR
ncbi:MFS transporter [Cupriavidus basilensis]